MKKLLIIFTITVVTIAVHSTLTTKVKAVSFEYPQYNVDITINKDSSFDVKESIVQLAFGEFHGLRRDLPLSDPDRDTLCSTANNLYCGGFDRVVVNSVHDLKGNDISNKINLYNVTDDATGKKSLRFEWELFPNGDNQNGYEQFGWVLDYTIYGGIATIQGNPYFYWNMLPDQRNGTVDSSNLTVRFPSDLTIRQSDLQVFTSLNYSKNIGNTLNFSLKNLPSYSPFTIAYKFNSDEIEMPGQISYSLLPAYGSKVFLDNIDITDQVDGIIKAVPTGNRTVRFEHIGYQTIEQTISVKPGETQIINAHMTPQPWMQALLLVNNLICVCGCLFIPIVLLAIYYHYRKNGRDKDMPKTIIPLFKPPVNTSPYMVGSVIDEKVDKQDVVGSIIDLAYRGYIKIKEVEKNKDYELIKLDGKEGDSGLNTIEQQIYNALFKSGDVVNTSELGKTFPTDYFRIQSAIYKEMVELNYFSRSPITTIGIYASFGIFIMIAGIVSLVLFTLLLVSFLGVLTVFTPGIVITVAGIALLVAAKFMPAKTSKGSKFYADILGFKMYMNTAERLTVQKLEPEDFVKYLSYAVVFGIEKNWAKKFEGIYKGVPDWYEGSGNFYDAYFISSFARSFSNSAVTSMTPITTNSASGRGWSGSGSFGGFSGGGGGGGSSGGW